MVPCHAAEGTARAGCVRRPPGSPPELPLGWGFGSASPPVRTPPAKGKGNCRVGGGGGGRPGRGTGQGTLWG